MSLSFPLPTLSYSVPICVLSITPLLCSRFALFWSAPPCLHFFPNFSCFLCTFFDGNRPAGPPIAHGIPLQRTTAIPSECVTGMATWSLSAWDAVLSTRGNLKSWPLWRLLQSMIFHSPYSCCVICVCDQILVSRVHFIPPKKKQNKKINTNKYTTMLCLSTKQMLV